MNAHISLQARVSDYLAERRRLGFELRTMGLALANFARYVASVHHRGALTEPLDHLDRPSGLGTTDGTGIIHRPGRAG